MIEPAADEGLKATTIQLQIFRGINIGLFGIAQRFGPRRAEGDDQSIAPFVPDLFEQVAALARSQIYQNESRAGLLQNSIQSIGILHMAQFGERAHVGLDPANEVRILRI
jgi:hypothetical protein